MSRPRSGPWPWTPACKAMELTRERVNDMNVCSGDFGMSAEELRRIATESGVAAGVLGALAATAIASAWRSWKRDQVERARPPSHQMHPMAFAGAQHPAAYGGPQHPAAYGVPQHPAAYGVPQHPAANGVPQHARGVRVTPNTLRVTHDRGVPRRARGCFRSFRTSRGMRDVSVVVVT